MNYRWNGLKGKSRCERLRTVFYTYWWIFEGIQRLAADPGRCLRVFYTGCISESFILVVFLPPAPSRQSVFSNASGRVPCARIAAYPQRCLFFVLMNVVYAGLNQKSERRIFKYIQCPSVALFAARYQRNESSTKIELSFVYFGGSRILFFSFSLISFSSPKNY